MSSKFENISIPSINSSIEKDSKVDIRLQVPLISRSSSNIKSKSLTDYLFHGFILLTVFGLIITNVVFCIISLVRSNGKGNILCPGSHLSVFIIVDVVLLLIIVILISKSLKKDEKNIKFWKLLFSLMISSGLFIWGWCELKGSECGSVLYHNEDTSLLYTMSEIQLIASGLLMGIIFILTIISANNCVSIETYK